MAKQKIKTTKTKTKYRKSKGQKRCSRCGRFMWYMKFFELTKADYDRLVEECMLDDEYKKLLEYKIKGYSRIKIATKLNISEFTVDKMIQKLKKKITKVL